MSVETIADGWKRAGLKPFVLKWAEKTPEELLWSHKSVFSAPVNGLEISGVAEVEKAESTGTSDLADSTHT